MSWISGSAIARRTLPSHSQSLLRNVPEKDKEGQEGQRGTGQIREKVQQDENGGVRSSFNDVEGPDHGLVNLVVGTKLQRPQQGGVTRL